MPELSLLWLLPLLYAVGASAARWCEADQRRWSIAENTALSALAAVAVAIAVAVRHFSAGGSIDSVGLGMALLIALLGWVIVRYSRRYLAGEEAQDRYAGALLFTLAAVSAVAVTQHLGVLVAAWIASSLGLHQLLLFFRERPAAQIVAHKKFLASRLAESCFVVAALCLYVEFDTLAIPALVDAIAQRADVSWTIHVAAVLIATGAILKSAQLPVHGWLLQVMEAPTPVSALLHAGIVNLGGFVLIRLAALIAAAPAAQMLLVIVGSLTAVLAGLVMMTRISIKVRLAWSTCAQMGFMLLECGLGLYELALLHLFAHSLYKAYAFLSAGETVLDYTRRSLLPLAPALPSHLKAIANLAAAPATGLIVVSSVWAWQRVQPGFDMAPVVMWILAIGMAPLLWARGVQLLRGIAVAIALTQLYFAWHALFGAMIAAHAPIAAPLALWTAVLFAAFFLAQVWLRAYPQGRFARSLYPWVYYGFYLDERFTRLTFRLWPARLAHRDELLHRHAASHHPLPGVIA